MRAFVAALVVVAATQASAAPSSDMVQEAKRRFSRANALYNEGRYNDALHLYQAAYDLVPSPDILFNLGLTREKVFDYEGCSLTFRQYLSETKDSSRKAQAVERLAHCREQTLIPVHVSSLPSAAAVTVDDHGQKSARGRTPARLDLKPGTYAITVDAPGYVGQTQTVTVEEGVHPDVDFSLEKLSSLAIEADVPAAEVRIDGKLEGATPLRRELPAGLYKIEVAKADYRPVERQVRVNAGEQISLMLSLPPMTRERAVSLVPAPKTPLAIAAVDGTEIGALPLSRKLSTGTHRLEIEAPGRQTLATDLRVPDDRDLKLVVDLEPKRTRAQRIAFWTTESVASALAAGGVVFGSLALADQASFNAHPSVAERNAGSSHALTADLLFGASAVVGIAGAIYYFATWPKHSRLRAQR